MSFLNLLGYSVIDPTSHRVFVDAFVCTVIIAISYVVIWFYWRGRNWARLMVLGTGFVALANVPTWNSHGPVANIMVVLEAVLALFLFYWLWRADVREYFRSRPKQTII